MKCWIWVESVETGGPWHGSNAFYKWDGDALGQRVNCDKQNIISQRSWHLLICYLTWNKELCTCDQGQDLEIDCPGLSGYHGGPFNHKGS